MAISIYAPTLLLQYNNDLPGDVICNIAIYADDTTLFSNCDQAFVDWGKQWLVDFNAYRTQLVSFDRSNNGSTDVKIDGSVLEEKSSFFKKKKSFYFIFNINIK